jgi:4'-phosphopantetheinyl transferase
MLSEEHWSRYLGLMPDAIRQKINGYQRWEDRQARLFGKLLILEGLKEFGGDKANLNYLSYKKFGKPFINDHVDFNISHSDEYVICAISNAGRVGVDIENIKPFDISEVDQYMTKIELGDIHSASDSCREFYGYWTIKESILKADGRGLSGDLRKMTIYPDKAIFQGQNWFLAEIDIDPNYSCHLATDLEGFDVQLNELYFGEEFE